MGGDVDLIPRLRPLIGHMSHQDSQYLHAIGGMTPILKEMYEIKSVLPNNCDSLVM